MAEAPRNNGLRNIIIGIVTLLGIFLVARHFLGAAVEMWQ